MYVIDNSASTVLSSAKVRAIKNGGGVKVRS